MKATTRLCFGLISISSVLAFVSCGDDDHGAEHGHEGGGTSHPAGGEAHGGAGHGDAATICQVLGHLCHDADTGAGPGADCHDLGHEGDGEACEQGFASCISTCVDTGEGGAGGVAGVQQDPYCAALGALCHAVDTGPGMGRDCHDIGHLGNTADCAASFDECGTFCLEELAKLEAAAGGAGGMGTGGATGSGLGGAGGAQ